MRLVNEYGPTETVVGSSAHTLPNGVHRNGPVPVGGPILNLTFHVLDALGRPLPAGLAGELYIGGAGVARGYLGRPALTAEKFVPRRYRGAVTLFGAGSAYACRAVFFGGRTAEEERVLGWARHVDGEIDLHVLPGTHATIASQPHVAVLAARMREALAAGRARVADDPPPGAAAGPPGGEVAR